MYNKELNDEALKKKKNYIKAMQGVINLHAAMRPDDTWGWNIEITDETVKNTFTLLDYIHDYIRANELDNQNIDYYPEIFPAANGDWIQFCWYDDCNNNMEIEFSKCKVELYKYTSGDKNKKLKDLPYEEWIEDEKHFTMTEKDKSSLPILMKDIMEFFNKEWEYVK